MKKKTKLCKDCKWCEEIIVNSNIYNKCRCPKNREIKVKRPPSLREIEADSLVSGKLKPAKIVIPKKKMGWRWTFCSHQRADGWLGSILINSCGKRGKWFEEKEIVITGIDVEVKYTIKSSDLLKKEK